MAKLKSTTLRLPEEVDKKLALAIEKGKAATKAELIRRAIDEYIDRHSETFR